MKTDNLNPWLIIRWALVVFVYAMTIAIAVDQVKTRDMELEDVSGKLREAKKELVATTKKRNEYQKSSAEWAAKCAEQAKATLDLIESQKRLMAATKAVEEAKSAKAALVPAALPAALPAPVIPAWLPPVSSVVTKTIRDRAMAEYKDNYPSLNYEIERQTDAFSKIVRYYKTSDPFIKSAINKAALEYGDNYSSFAYDVERQIEARQKFNAR